MAFLHSHLVAHGDFGPDELLLNYGGAHYCVETKKARDEYGPFRSYFPARYYIVDFETAVRFDKASDPASRVIQGFPAFSSHTLTDPSHYGKVRICFLRRAFRLD